MKPTRFLTILVLAPLGLWSIGATAKPVAGDKVYTATCAACHGSGVLGAPKFGDKAAWAPRIKQGKDTLYAHALAGIRMMPARGGNPALKDAEVKAAIDYMVGKAL
jgi:cytochrome c5